MAHRDPSAEELKILEEIRESMRRLERLGWSNPMSPIPRDRHILVVEAGSTGVFRGRYESAHFFIEDGGDLWPSRPLAWKEDDDGDA